jgi:tRNA threonylcarbamoyladenosine biosynthesis protein TsaB
MLLLAVDTSGKNGSLALVRVTPGEKEVAVLEVVPLDGGAFSAQLVPQIAASLERHGHNKRDLGVFAVVNGPGSFTGLRVGLAAIKGLAEALQKPIVALSLLEAVAQTAAERGRILAALNAGRGDAYVGDYEIFGDATQSSRVISERLLSREELLAAAVNAAAEGGSIATPDPALADALRAAGIAVQQVEYPNAGVIARIGWARFERGETVSPNDLEANYMRRSDAEIFSKP